MTHSKYLDKMQALAGMPSFSASDARRKGVPTRMLSYFLNKGIIHRISRGQYTCLQTDLNVPFEWEDLARVATSIPNGIICLISALCIYDLTDEIMREYWIAIPHDQKPPKRPRTRFLRTRNFDLRRETIQIGNCTLQIYDHERTVVDAFRFLSLETAIKALRAYLSSKEHKPNFNKISEYARVLRVNIRPYVETLTT